MRQARKHLTYSNVAATLALFLVLSSGVAFAATKISSKDIKPGAIKTKQLARKAVTTGKLAPGAVKSGKIAPGAVGGAQLAPGAVGASQLGPDSVGASNIIDGSITPNDLAPTPIVPAMLTATTAATVTGGPVSVPTGAEEEEEEGEEGEEEPGPAEIPLTGGTWTQGPQEHNIYLAQVEAILGAEEGEECGIEVTLNVDGEPVGTIPAILPEAPEEEEGEEEGEEEAPSPPTTVTRGQVAGPNLATGAAQNRVMTATATIGEDAVCESAEVKSLKVVVLGIG
jgi:hypothetical protein